MDARGVRVYQRAMRVVSIGECMIELSGREGDRWRMGYAGDTFNTLWYLRALLPADAMTDYVSAFGDDPFSVDQITFLADHGIGIAKSPQIDGAVPGLYAITLDDAGERSFTYWRSQAAARRLADDADALSHSLAGADLAYVSGITLAVLEPAARDTLFSALATARKAGSLVAFDPNYRPRLWPDGDTARSVVDRAYDVCDIALPTFDDEQALYGDATAQDTAERIAAHGVDTIIVKAGDAPCLIKHGAEIDHVDPVANVTPVDTTGAGDSFNGAFLAAHLVGRDRLDAARNAHAIAARVIGHHGALMPMDALRPAR
ncbi:MAG: sugar kinase [Phyllobacteriaceae bacterium]|nr:sugar kinase [Phyllobacteriaceae bacterium]